MTLIAGIDPGTGGAVAVYDTSDRQIIHCEDLPFWYQTVGKTKRKRLDPVGLIEMFECLNMFGVELLVMEAVGGRPRQSASAGFVFGYTVGLMVMACMMSKIPLETVPPRNWKKVLNVSGKAKAEDDDIINRANELFPHNRHYFKNKNGTKLVDRAEAAMIAKFGGDHVWTTIGSRPANDEEFKMAYRNAGG